MWRVRVRAHVHVTPKVSYMFMVERWVSVGPCHTNPFFHIEVIGWSPGGWGRPTASSAILCLSMLSVLIANWVQVCCCRAGLCAYLRSRVHFCSGWLFGFVFCCIVCSQTTCYLSLCLSANLICNFPLSSLSVSCGEVCASRVRAASWYTLERGQAVLCWLFPLGLRDHRVIGKCSHPVYVPLA